MISLVGNLDVSPTSSITNGECRMSWLVLSKQYRGIKGETRCDASRCVSRYLFVQRKCDVSVSGTVQLEHKLLIHISDTAPSFHTLGIRNEAK